MSSSGGTDWISRARGLSPSSAASRGVSGIILAGAGAVIAVIAAIGDGLAEILGIFSAGRDFLVTLITAPEMIIVGGAQATVESFTTGDWAFFGPATFALAVGSVAGGYWVWTVVDPSIPVVNDIIPWR